jgi:hypothetical protein
MESTEIGQDGVETSNGVVWYLGLTKIAGTSDYQIYDLNFNVNVKW